MQYDAYGIPGSQILGISPELEKVTFDIQAKFDPSAYPQAQMSARGQYSFGQQMMQQLLADKFKLAVHTETRQLPVYALVIANPKTGPQTPTRHRPQWYAHVLRQWSTQSEGRHRRRPLQGPHQHPPERARPRHHRQNQPHRQIRPHPQVDSLHGLTADAQRPTRHLRPRHLYGRPGTTRPQTRIHQRPPYQFSSSITPSYHRKTSRTEGNRC
jgi:hypothetical protein